jgi:predicted RNase H-like nuclease
LQDSPIAAIGVDGAPDGWALACLRAPSLDEEARGRWRTELRLLPSIVALANFRADEASNAPVCIDIPIGLLDSVAFRPCDRAARKILGAGRAPCVFMPPARYMLPAAGDYPAIRALVEKERKRSPRARSLSAQSAGIAPKVREVDEWVRAHSDSDEWLFECHPEVSFHALAGRPIPHAKSSAAGTESRLRTLEPVFPDAEEQIASAPWPAKQVGLPDLLDAYAALATALACARGVQRTLGGERDSEGIVMRMVM